MKEKINWHQWCLKPVSFKLHRNQTTLHSTICYPTSTYMCSRIPWRRKKKVYLYMWVVHEIDGEDNTSTNDKSRAMLPVKINVFSSFLTFLSLYVSWIFILSSYRRKSLLYFYNFNIPTPRNLFAFMWDDNKLTISLLRESIHIDIISFMALR